MRFSSRNLLSPEGELQLNEMYQPLRVPPGWRIDWNTLFEVDPTEENVRRGFFGGSSLFSATHDHMRLRVEVAWRPEDDPAGEYRLTVECAPWLRTEEGRRRKGVLAFRNAQVVHEYQTRVRAELARELEAALVGRREWVERS